MKWQTSRRQLSLEKPLVMGILNVTPDSFSDGGAYVSVDDALRRADAMIAEGADIIDVGGESTRPGCEQVSVDDEVKRTAPLIEAISRRFDTPISIDTTKSEVAALAIAAGAEIINDISGLRFDDRIAEVAARSGAGLVLMHSRGAIKTLHSQSAVEDIIAAVIAGLHVSVSAALSRGVSESQIAIDPGIGFGKTPEQNLELLAKLDNIVNEFHGLPVLVGASRKSFIAKALGDIPAEKRLGGSIAAALIAATHHAHIIRVHDVRETVQALQLTAAIGERID